VARVQEYLSLLLGVTAEVNYGGVRFANPTLPIGARRADLRSPLGRASTDWANSAAIVALGLPSWPTNRAGAPIDYWTGADTSLGSLGDLRDVLGLFSQPQVAVAIANPRAIPERATWPVPFYINTIADEQDATNFRILVDYANSLLNAWRNSIQFFAGRQSQFLGTQLVVISRQLGVISEVVDEVRFVLDSVFIGPAQRDTLQVEFGPLPPPPAAALFHLPPIYLSDLLQWMQDYVGPEAQDVIQNAGKFGLGEDFIRTIEQLFLQACGLYEFARRAGGAFGTPRVLQSLYKLALQLSSLYEMAEPIGVRYLAPRF
jgi:hypothetical protein